MVRPRRERMLRVSTSAGRSALPCSSMPTVRRTASVVSVSPFSISSSSSAKSRSARALSAGAPVMVISLPRTWMSLATDALDEPQDLVARAEQADHDLRVGDGDLGLHPGRGPGGGVPVIGRAGGPCATCSRSRRRACWPACGRCPIVSVQRGIASPPIVRWPRSARRPRKSVPPSKVSWCAGEPVGRPVHPDHRARPRPGSAAAAPRPPGRRPCAARPAGPAAARRPPAAGPAGSAAPRARSAPSRQEKTYSKPSLHQRPSTDAVAPPAPAAPGRHGSISAGSCSTAGGEQLVRQRRRSPPAVPDEPSTAAAHRRRRALAAPPAVRRRPGSRAWRRRGRRASTRSPCGTQDQAEPEARAPRAPRR